MKPRVLIELLVIGVLCVCAALVFRNAFLSWGFVPTVVAGVALPIGVSVLARRAGTSSGAAILVSMMAYLGLGSIIISGAPTPDAVSTLIRETVQGWQGLLTIAAPVDPADTLRVVPLATVWLGSVIAAETVLRTRSLLAPVLGPSVIFLLAALFGLKSTSIATQLGVILLLGVVAFVSLRHETSWVWSASPDRTMLIVRSLSAIAILALSALIAGVMSPRVQGSSPRDRVTLRQVVDPPFVIRDLRTPLTTFKDSLNSEAENSVVFTVSGSDLAGRRVRLATLDEYDGVVWTSASVGGSDGLLRVGPRFPGLVDSPIGVEERFEFVLGDLEGNWLPTVGVPQAMRWGDSAVELLGSDPFSRFRVDPDSGNLLVDIPVGPGFGRQNLSYEIQAVDFTSSDLLPDTPTVPMRLIDSDLVAPFRDLARSIVGQEATAIQRIERIGEALSSSTDGTVVSSSGQGKNATYDLDAPPGHALYRVRDTLFQDADEYRGTAEQYATAFALLAAAVDVPSRVVVGYEINASNVEAGDSRDVASIRRSDLSVWLEVPFLDAGWIAFDAGPSESAVPEDRPAGGGGSSSVSTVPPPPFEDDLDAETNENEQDDPEECEADCDEEPDVDNGVAAVVYVAAGGGLIVGLVLLAAGAVLLLKQRRRARRRRAPPPLSVAGAWSEMLDVMRDSGHEVPSGSTLHDTVVDLRETPANEQIGELSKLVERVAFGERHPSEVDADQAWAFFARVEAKTSSAESVLDSARRKLSITSLRG